MQVVDCGYFIHRFKAVWLLKKEGVGMEVGEDSPN